jgi:hypothetical protein
MMELFFKRFVSEDKGSVTADWMVLTAGIIMLCSAVVVSLSQPAQDMADNAPAQIETQDQVI